MVFANWHTLPFLTKFYLLKKNTRGFGGGGWKEKYCNVYCADSREHQKIVKPLFSLSALSAENIHKVSETILSETPKVKMLRG